MNDENSNSENDGIGEGKDAEGGVVDKLIENAIALKTGLPPQVQRSFWKAFGRVFTAGAEWPARFLEGKGKIADARALVEVARHEAEAADIKSLQKAREVINRESATAAALQFGDPQLATRALAFHGAHIVREQQRIEEVLEIAAEELRLNPPSHDSTDIIEDDVLETILREGSRRSSQEFKTLFGRILAGEIKNPGAFSIGTIQSIGRLNQRTAEIFQTLCNISTSGVTNPKVISDPYGHPGENALASVGLSYANLAMLVEEGLLRPDFQEWQDIPCNLAVGDGVKFEHAGENLVMVRSQAAYAPELPAIIRVSGPSFTKVGQELRSVVTMTPSEEYRSKLVAWFAAKGVGIFRVTREENGKIFGSSL